MSGATDEERRAVLVWNERRKLQATWLNNLGVALVVIGTVTPVVTYLYGLASAPRFDSWNVVLLPIGALTVGLGLNMASSAILGFLE